MRNITSKTLPLLLPLLAPSPFSAQSSSQSSTATPWKVWVHGIASLTTPACLQLFGREIEMIRSQTYFFRFSFHVFCICKVSDSFMVLAHDILSVCAMLLTWIMMLTWRFPQTYGSKVPQNIECYNVLELLSNVGYTSPFKASGSVVFFVFLSFCVFVFLSLYDADCLWRRQQRLGSQSDSHKLGIKWERCKSGADSWRVL